MARDPLQILEVLRAEPRFISGVTAWRHIPASSGKYCQLPEDLHPSLSAALSAKGITELYSHQGRAYELATRGCNVCVVTPTASGKTLCYNLPVLNSILKDPEVRALYMFPTKALAQDQLAEIEELSRLGGFQIKSFTYDGDTPSHKRRLAKDVGQIVITNPDMLHQAILPHHSTWVRMFAGLKFVVIDEMHGYRGVFGSHVANVIRRLKRIAAFYGANPVFILASATIANPGELASALVGEPVEVIQENGAPSSAKEFVFFNPPALSDDGSVRQSALDAAARIASYFIREGVQTIVFARSRIAVELLVQYLRDRYPDRFNRERIQGYRGGYLPDERRRIEKGLREGEIIGVAATNALELGIDIGSLDCVVMAGYPGTISSTWQQAGRAGRRKGHSVAILVAGPSPLDQFIIKNADYFFSQAPEYALINPDNPYILAEHVKCAAYELPFPNEPGNCKLGDTDVAEILEYLKEQGILHLSSSKWYWSSDAFPAASVSLRSASSDNFVVVDVTKGPEVIGEVDWASAPLLIHDEAIYMHQGKQYHVIKLDYGAKKAYVKPVNVDYYTDANLAVNVRVISVDRSKPGPLSPRFGELSITAVATIYKKIKLYTHENVGSGQIALPEMNMHTEGMWFTLPEDSLAGLDPRVVGAALSGIGNVLMNIAPLFLMCDKKDLGVAVEVRSSLDGKPTIFMYDAYPGGVGLALRAFEILPDMLKASLELIRSCECKHGCPGCVGPSEGLLDDTKELCLRILAAAAGEVVGHNG